MADGSIAKRWKELSGEKHWEGIMKPIDGDLKKYLIHYGELTMATYDTFITEAASKFTGGSMFNRGGLFKGVGLQSRHKELHKYTVTKYLYATSKFDIPGFPAKSSASNAWYQSSNWMGYVAIATDEGKTYLGRRDIVVAWRGTLMPTEWSKDFNSGKSSAKDIYKSDVKCHSGFLSVYTSYKPTSKYNKQSARDQAIAEVQKLVSEHKGEDISISVCGHSLGGALAHLFATDVVVNGINKSDKPILVTAFPFASPRVGDSSFKKLVDSLGAASNSPAAANRLRAEPGGDLRILRIVNKADMVPKSPPAYFLGFTHVGQRYLINGAISSSLGNPFLIAIAHDMESSYLHGLSISKGSGALQASDQGEIRDLALVNKYQDALKPEYNIPAKWWKPENKGMVQGRNGDWKNRLGDWIEKEKESDTDDVEDEI